MKEVLKIKEVYLFQGEETKFNFHFGYFQDINGWIK